MIPPKRYDSFSPDWGMLRRFRRVPFFFKYCRPLTDGSNSHISCRKKSSPWSQGKNTIRMEKTYDVLSSLYDKENANVYMTKKMPMTLYKWIAAEKVRTRLRYAVVHPNVTGSTKYKVEKHHPEGKNVRFTLSSLKKK